MLGRFPVGSAGIGPKREATMQEYDSVNDKGECTYNVGVVLKLLEA